MVMDGVAVKCVCFINRFLFLILLPEMEFVICFMSKAVQVAVPFILQFYEEQYEYAFCIW